MIAIVLSCLLKSIIVIILEFCFLHHVKKRQGIACERKNTCEVSPIVGWGAGIVDVF